MRDAISSGAHRTGHRLVHGAIRCSVWSRSSHSMDESRRVARVRASRANPAMTRWLLCRRLQPCCRGGGRRTGPLGLNTLELKTYDARMRAVATGAGTRRRRSASSSRRPHSSVSSSARWSLAGPRVVHSLPIDFLARGPAKVVAYDVFQRSFDAARRRYPRSDLTGQESDDALVDSVKKAGNVILLLKHRAKAGRPVENEQAPLGAVASSTFVVGQRLCREASVADAAVPGAGVGCARCRTRAVSPTMPTVPPVATCRSWRSADASCRVAATGCGNCSSRRDAEQGVGVARRAPTRRLRVPWVEQVVPEFYGPA